MRLLSRLARQRPFDVLCQLDPYAFYFPSNSNTYLTDDIITPIHGGSRSIPGRVGARYAGMYKDLFPSHYNVNLTATEFRSVVLWLDWQLK